MQFNSQASPAWCWSTSCSYGDALGLCDDPHSQKLSGGPACLINDPERHFSLLQHSIPAPCTLLPPRKLLEKYRALTFFVCSFANLAFAEGGHAVARVRSIMFRCVLAQGETGAGCRVR